VVSGGDEKRKKVEMKIEVLKRREEGRGRQRRQEVIVNDGCDVSRWWRWSTYRRRSLQDCAAQRRNVEISGALLGETDSRPWLCRQCFDCREFLTFLLFRFLSYHFVASDLRLRSVKGGTVQSVCFVVVVWFRSPLVSHHGSQRSTISCMMMMMMMMMIRVNVCFLGFA